MISKYHKSHVPLAVRQVLIDSHIWSLLTSFQDGVPYDCYEILVELSPIRKHLAEIVDGLARTADITWYDGHYISLRCIYDKLPERFRRLDYIQHHMLHTEKYRTISHIREECLFLCVFPGDDNDNMDRFLLHISIIEKNLIESNG